ncbi:MAG TPA: hypothetical protein VGH29_18195 [Candidatus Binataceae bacterium]
MTDTLQATPVRHFSITSISRAELSNSKSLHGAGLGFCGLLLPIPGRRVSFQRTKKTTRYPCYLIDGGQKRTFIRLRWFVETADFSDELERRRSDLFVGDGRLEIKKDFDIPAHSP